MSLALVHSRARAGVDAPLVRVEVHLSGGLPATQIVGLAETSVRESRERVRAALLCARFDFPQRRITLNLAPADLPKEGGRYDLAIALGILSGKEPSVAVAIAATIGIAGTILFNFMMVLNSYWNHRADVALEQGDEQGVYLNSAIFPQASNFVLRFVPTFIAVYFGNQYIEGFMNSLPELVIRTMTVVGGILPAVGIAILLKQIIKQNSMLIYFLVGFVGIVFLKLNMVGLVMIGALLALIHYNYKPEPRPAPAARAATQTDDEDEF